jgi:hypothetical protein
MSFFNKKAVEALPLRYIIIALVAALVVGIALQMTGTLRGGIQGTAEKLNASVTEKVTCELDEEAPKIIAATLTCNGVSKSITVTADVTDDCGVNEVWAYVENKLVTFSTTEKDLTDATWTGSKTDNAFTGTIEGYVYAKDKSTAGNAIDTQTKAFYINATCS